MKSGSHVNRPASHGDLQIVSSPQLERVMGQLTHAKECARDASREIWDFAVEIDALTAMGLTADDIRWLVTNGYVRHGQEVTKQSDAARNFHPVRDLTFTKQACFVVTDAGLRLTTAVPVGSGLRRAA